MPTDHSRRFPRVRPCIRGFRAAVIGAALACVLLGARVSSAQDAAAADPVSATRPAPAPATSVFRISPEWLSGLAAPPAAPERACNGCPARRPLYAAVEVVGINVAYNLMNQLFRPAEERGQFQVGWASWENNLKYGFEWDDNAFAVNQFGHPYQGGNYFTAARSNGLSFWESSAYAALGSATWEYFGETHHPALNDFINTTMGGMAIGEMLHRLGWMVRDPSQTGGARTRSELLATALDPVTGLNRFLSGEASRVAEKPPDMMARVTGDVESGVLWRGDDTKAVNATGEPYVQFNLNYGDMLNSPSRVPWDAFAAAIRLGGGSKISEALFRGRLHGQHFGGRDGRAHQFMVLQAYDYVSNNVYEFGGQTVAGVVTSRFALSDRRDIVTSGGGGIIALGAFSSPYIFGEQRDYDYGPGVWGSANAALRWNGVPVAKLSYNLLYLHVVSGTAGDHVAQAVSLDGFVPLKKQLHLGLSASYVRRKIYYDFEQDVDNLYPQFRVYLAWVNK
jgi:hypothetical protein